MRICAVALATVIQCMRRTQCARITRLAAEAGEVIIGEVITGIRTLDILGSAIMARATAIRMAAIMVTDLVGATIRTTDTVPADLIHTDTGTDPRWASASAGIKLNQHH